MYESRQGTGLRTDRSGQELGLTDPRRFIDRHCIALSAGFEFVTINSQGHTNRQILNDSQISVYIHETASTNGFDPGRGRNYVRM